MESSWLQPDVSEARIGHKYTKVILSNPMVWCLCMTVAKLSYPKVNFLYLFSSKKVQGFLLRSCKMIF